MFKIVKQRSAWWPVTWNGVTEEGRVVENKVEFHFQLLKVDDAVKLMDEAARLQDHAADGEVPKSREFAITVERIADNWRGVAGENGEPLPWSTDNLALLMNEPQVFDRLVAAYRDCLAGGPEQRRGN